MDEDEWCGIRWAVDAVGDAVVVDEGVLGCYGLDHVVVVAVEASPVYRIR